MTLPLVALLLAAGGPLKSATALAFGPDGTLYVADPQVGAVVAVPTPAGPPGTADLAIDDLGGKLAKLLGTADLTVNDLKVRPTAGELYLSVTAGKGDAARPAVVRVGHDGTPAAVDVTGKACVLAGAKNTQRQEAITCMAVAGNRLLVAGLSNEEFASTFRVIPLPLPAEAGKGTGIEVYHAAHGKTETHAPIRTFVPYTAGGVEYVMAAYTCTPLVRLAAADLKPGAKLTGVTVAELGNRNTPLDLIAYQKGGKDFLLMTNTARGVMKIPADPAAAAEGLTRPVRGGGVAGLPFEPVPLDGVVQMDKLDADRAVVLVRGADKVLSVRTVPLP